MELSPTPRALLLLCRLHLEEADRRALAALAPQVSWQELVKLARRGGVAGLIQRNLQGLTFVQREVLLELTRSSLLIEVQNRAMLSEAFSLYDGTRAAGIQLVPIKGAALNLSRPYDDPGLRGMCDLDLLTSREEVPRLEALLAAQGFVPEGDRDHDLRFSHHLRFSRAVEPAGKQRTGQIQRRVLVELHWTGLIFNRAHHGEERAMLERASWIEVDGHSVCMLSLEDQMFILLIHLAGHRFRSGLKWLVDVAELARAQEGQIDWDRIWALARRVGAYRAAALGVTLARELLGAPIPAPPIRDRLLPLLASLCPVEELVESSPQPSGVARGLIDLLGFDSPASGFQALRLKLAELAERHTGLRAPRFLSRGDPLG